MNEILMPLTVGPVQVGTLITLPQAVGIVLAVIVIAALTAAGAYLVATWQS